MAIVRRKPRNASLRFQTYLDSSDITKKKPEKGLTVGLRKKRAEMHMAESLYVIVVEGLLEGIV